MHSQPVAKQVLGAVAARGQAVAVAVAHEQQAVAVAVAAVPAPAVVAVVVVVVVAVAAVVADGAPTSCSNTTSQCSVAFPTDLPSTASRMMAVTEPMSA